LGRQPRALILPTKCFIFLTIVFSFVRQNHKILTSKCLFPYFKKAANHLKSHRFICVALLMLLLPSRKKEREEIEGK